MDTNFVTTSDIYEASFYFMSGAQITGIEVIEELKRQICKITLKSDNFILLQNEYFQGKAQVNIFEFRRSYSRISNLVVLAKREAKKKEKALKTQNQIQDQGANP
jgi:hypothetical protein